MKRRVHKRSFNRTERVADLIQKAVAEILLTKLSDERFHLVTIVGVTVSHDLSYAKLYCSVLEQDEMHIKKIIFALNRAAKHIRHLLAGAVDLRIMPEIKFIYDETIAHGFKIDALINQALKK